MNKTSITRNQLGMDKSIKLASWLNSKKSHQDWSRLGSDGLIKLASQELGFIITEINIRSVAKAAEIKLPYTPRRSSDMTSSKNKQRAKVDSLRKAILELCEKLGEVSPECLDWSRFGE